MKALVKRGKGIKGVDLEEVEEPRADEGFVKIKVHAAGICGTDLHIIQEEYPHVTPVILGHEFSGTIEEVGSNDSLFKKGDRVVSLTASETCGRCSYCRQGRLMLCEERKSIGSGLDGAFAQYIVVPEKNVYQIPENISMDTAALTEPLACVVRCVMERGQIYAGQKVLISGCGTIGLLALQVVIANGGSAVITGTSTDEDRFKLASQLGALEIINVEEDSDIKKLNHESNFDVTIECAGSAASLNTCIQNLKKQGLLIQVGLFGKEVFVNLDLMLIKELYYINGFASNPSSWEITLNLLAQEKLDINPLISNRYRIDNWKAAIQAGIKKQGLKNLIYPNDTLMRF